MGGPIHNQHTVTVMANTRVQQQTLVDANLPDNSTNLITPEKHREVETESISASAFVDDNNTFTGNNEFEQPIIVGEATISAAVGSSNFQAGLNAGVDNTGTACNQIGSAAGQDNTASNCNQIGESAGVNNEGANCNQIGNSSGLSNTGVQCNQIGTEAGRENTGADCVQIGGRAGNANTGAECVQIGRYAGGMNTGDYCVQIGYEAGLANTNANGIVLGKSAGYDGTNGYTGADDVFAIANASIPSFADKNAAETAITALNGYPAGSTYLYRNNQHGWIGFVTI